MQILKKSFFYEVFLKGSLLKKEKSKGNLLQIDESERLKRSVYLYNKTGVNCFKTYSLMEE